MQAIVHNGHNILGHHHYGGSHVTSLKRKHYQASLSDLLTTITADQGTKTQEFGLVGSKL